MLLIHRSVPFPTLLNRFKEILVPFGGFDLCHTKGNVVRVTFTVCEFALVGILQDTVRDVREGA